MANMYGHRQMYQSPILFYLLIPIGCVILFYLVDFGFKIYYETKLNKDTKEILYLMMENEDLDSLEEYKEYAKNRFSERGYETNDVSVIEDGGYIILINYNNYFSIVGEVLTKTKKVAVARYKGYYNEYQETVVEKFTTEDDEALSKKYEEDSGNTEEVIN